MSCIRAWQSLAFVDITISVDPVDSSGAFESVTALSNLSWCKFNHSAVGMASISVCVYIYILYMCMACEFFNGMSHCLCSGFVEVILIVQAQHINNRKYTNS
jgi:hypothetical protein